MARVCTASVLCGNFKRRLHGAWTRAAFFPGFVSGLGMKRDVLPYGTVSARQCCPQSTRNPQKSKMRVVSFLSAALVLSSSLHAQLAFHSWAGRPVMGWNSWDFYGTTVTEDQTKAQADYMAANLLPHGWNLITVDIQWYAPNPAGDGSYFNYDTPNNQLVMDGNGRLQPAATRFPSAAGGAGFTALADYVHSKGLKFGIHLMRGIPRQAVIDDLPILGTSYTAQDVANTSSTCPWNPDMYGVDMTKPGAQEYYDSLFSMYASWGVDLVKVDDLSRPYHLAEIEAIREAIDKTGREIVLSTSPGETPVGQGAHVMLHANQWRISDDFWDNWNALYDQFQRLHDWTPYRGPGHFPDADMLPLGKIVASGGDTDGRATNFTQDEQYTLMSLWSIARSPLIHGGDMTQMDAFTLSLFTNDEAIAVNQYSTHNRQLFRDGDLVAWVADDENSSDKYLAVFNTGGATANVPVELSTLGFTGSVQIRSLWDQADLGAFSGTFSPSIASHGAALYRLSGALLPTPWITAANGDDSEVTVTWESLSSADSYRIKRATAEAGPYQLIAENLTGTTFTDTGLSNGITYYYVVSAMIAGEETPDSGARSAIPAGPPGIVGWNYDRYGTVDGARLAGVEPATNWNNSWPNNPLTNLIDEQGAPTTLDISYNSYNTWTANNPQANPGQDADGSYNRELLNGYLNAGPASWNPPVTATSVSLAEIPHGQYHIIVYFSSDAAGREGDVTDGTTTYSFNTIGPASVSGSNAVFAQTTDTAGTYAAAANYAVFSGLSGASQTITVQMRDDGEWGGIAAIQVVPDPVPNNDYTAWIGTYPGVGGLTGFNDDADGDGIANGLENLFGTDPSVSSGGITQVAKNGSTVTFQHPQNASPASDVSAAYEWSTDIATFHADGASDGGTTVSFAASPGDPATVTATITGTVPARLFVRMKATQNTP